MQSVLLPASICDNIDRLNRDFLWGSDRDCKKMHHVNWATVCLSKERGGLGIRTAKETNVAMVSKLGWRILNNDSAQWCQAMRHNYLKSNTLWECPRPQRSSAAWKAILESRDLLRAGAIWRIDNGNDVRFWTDRWLEVGPLAEIVDNPAPETSDSFRVAQVIGPDGEWSMDLLAALLPHDLLERV